MSDKNRNSFYNSSAWKRKREEILDRDNHECIWCKEQLGKVTTDRDGHILEIDHIKPLEQFPELALEDSNLRTLCRQISS